ncbi:MAG TPA: GAF domain-containing protein [Acetobacteraceae bacterium]|jgi:two-component system NtrC family sensor kinase|nr:GAF domain-containing protein [Acetobacteraceae bacterium]
MGTTQNGTTSEPPRTIAKLRQELSEREAALAQRNSELGERIEHQAATIEVLKAMSTSLDDAQPVFDRIAREAAKLCNVPTAAVAILDGAMMHLATQSGFDAAYADADVSQFPRPVGLDSAMGRAILNRRVEQVEDITTYPGHSSVDVLGHWSVLAVPMLRDGRPLGAITIGRPVAGRFSDSQVTLLQTFAAQAVIAISSADTYRKLNQRTADFQEALGYQTAISEVLNVISRSGFDLQPVLDTLVETAARICRAESGFIFRLRDGLCHMVASFGISAEYQDFQARNPIARGRGTLAGRIAVERRAVHIEDAAADPEYTRPEAVRLGHQRTMFGVPLVREDILIGVITLARARVEPFTEKQIALVSTFADQALIAIENTRLLTEQREALEQQTAITEVLQVINASPGQLAPVFDAMLEKATALCEGAFATLVTYDGERFTPAAAHGVPTEFADFRSERGAFAPPQGSSLERVATGENLVHIANVTTDPGQANTPLVELGGCRTLVCVALRKEEALIGALTVYRQEVRPFAEKQIALLQNFAAQAVIAMETARLLDELRRRQQELRVTFENMGDGVAMFDETPRLVAWNRKFQEILDISDNIVAKRETYANYIRYLAERGEYGAVDPEVQLRRFEVRAGEHYVFERTRPDGRIIEVRHNPVSGGGFVLIFSDVTERNRNEAELRAARDAAEQASRTIEGAFRDLKAAQANLIQAEKMASLGQLTAGIAHEIKNPLNFVNNFSELSRDLLDELNAAVAPNKLAVAADLRAEIDDLTTALKGNLEKIVQHGRRADSIVKNMLLHSRSAPSEHRAIDLNAIVDEALNLAYHGARAETPGFNITVEKDLDPAAGMVDLYPQEFIRVMLNLINNGFYAARNRANQGAVPDFEPTLGLTTRNLGKQVEIRVRDNGAGIREAARDKIFEPFFTTKPAGEGTGLGLSLSYDIIVKQHGGRLTVDSRIDAFTEFQISLPRAMAATGGGQA